MFGQANNKRSKNDYCLGSICSTGYKSVISSSISLSYILSFLKKFKILFKY
jgi:hypothetical protein